jgi:hypothetical protein
MSWTPGEISPTLWVQFDDTDTLDIIGGAVQSVTSKGSVAATFAATLEARRPTYLATGLNGKGVIEMNGTAQTLNKNTSTDILRNTGAAIALIVCKLDSLTLARSALSIQRGDNFNFGRFQFRSDSTNPRYRSFMRQTDAADASGLSHGSDANTTDWVVLTSLLDYANGTHKFYVNGTLSGEAIGFATGSNSSDTAAARMHIGSQQDGNASFWPGKIAEIIIVEEDDTTETRQTLEGYAHWEYGLEANLPTGHPYEDAAPAGADGELRASVPGPLAAPTIAAASTSAMVSVPGPLAAPKLLPAVDFTVAVAGSIDRYVMDIVGDSGTVRIPISSWQATLQTGRANYVQAVVPAADQWIADINAADELVISRVATAGDLTIEYEMAKGPIQTVSYQTGANRRTATLSGFSDGFAVDEDPSAVYDRTLADIRSISIGGGTRARCKIDWLLRPGQRADADGTQFIVAYINYYCLGNDSYMDVGDRSGG